MSELAPVSADIIPNNPEKRKLSQIFKSCLNGEMSPLDAFSEVLGATNNESTNSSRRTKNIVDSFYAKNHPSKRLERQVANLIQEEPDWCYKNQYDWDISYSSPSVIDRLMESPLIKKDPAFNDFLTASLNQNLVAEQLSSELNPEVQRVYLDRLMLCGSLAAVISDKSEGSAKIMAAEAAKNILESLPLIHRLEEELGNERIYNLTLNCIEAVGRSTSEKQIRADNAVWLTDLVTSWLSQKETRKIGLIALPLVLRNCKDTNGYQNLWPKMLRSLVSATGLDYDTIVYAWRNTENFKDDPQLKEDVFSDNFTRCCHLEAAQPGICQYLFKEYGIATFGKYPKEVLLDQYSDRDSTDQPYGIVFSSWSDWNGYLSHRQTEITDLADKVTPFGYKVKVLEIPNERTLVSSLNRLRHKFGQAAFGVIYLHGDESSMIFGSGRHESEVNASDFHRNGYRALRLAFRPDATIVLGSCETGFDHGVAQEISGLGFNVLAPKIQLNSLSYKVTADPANSLKFNVDFSEGRSKNILKKIFIRKSRFVNGSRVAA